MCSWIHRSTSRRSLCERTRSFSDSPVKAIFGLLARQLSIEIIAGDSTILAVETDLLAKYDYVGKTRRHQRAGPEGTGNRVRPYGYSTGSVRERRRFQGDRVRAIDANCG